VLGTRFVEAVEYAEAVHRTQVRNGTEIPYLSHLLATAALALEHGADEDQAIAALLHDAAEDHGGYERLADIRARFGDRVAGIVEGCTDTFDRPKPPWRPRKEAHLDNLRTQANADVLLAAACDKLHNARSILADYRTHGEELWQRFGAGRESLWYYGAMLEVFTPARIPAALHRELKATIETLLAEANYRP
jgi:(p)ppGpp synthase/HD superfamily hydrolase